MTDQPYGEDPLRKRPDPESGDAASSDPYSSPSYGQPAQPDPYARPADPYAQQPPYDQQPDPYGQQPSYGQPQDQFGQPGYGASYGAGAYGQDPYAQQPSQDAADAKRQGIIATVVGAIVTLCCCPPAGLVGLGLGIAGLVKSSSDVAGSRKFSRISFIVTAASAVIGIVVNGILFASGFYDSYQP